MVDFNPNEMPVSLTIQREDKSEYRLNARFVLDASGYFRLLPRLLGWEIETGLTQRNVYCTHINDNITDPLYDRYKSTIAIHPKFPDIWVWLIPFANGRASVGVVGESHYFQDDRAASKVMKKFVMEIPFFARILQNAFWENDAPFLFFSRYDSGVKQMYGDNFALLGNAAGFFGPRFLFRRDHRHLFVQTRLPSRYPPVAWRKSGLAERLCRRACIRHQYAAQLYRQLV